MRICQLTLSRVADDPRIRRHGDALSAAGYDVVAVGAPHARSAAPDWPVHELGIEATRDGGVRRLLTLPVARLGERQAERVWWSSPVNREIWEQVRDVAADIYVANDWPMLPLAARLAEVHHARFVYDTHEYAVEEHAERRRWRLVYPPYIHGLEQANAPRAAAVMTVSDGIAALLQQDLGLARRPAVVRNVPPYREVPDHPVSDEIEVLYQGMLAPDRGVEALVTSVEHWRPGRRLVVRGLGEERFVAHVRGLDRSRGRIRFDPPGRPQELVELAGRSDVGIHPISGATSQIRFCLPNKFFEYVMAGLALCVTDLPEMRRLVAEFDVGLTMPTPDAGGIAEAVNALEPDQVMTFRRNARRAARELSWETEQQRLLDVMRLAVEAPSQ